MKLTALFSYWTIVEGESIFFPIHTQCRTILDHALRTSDKNVLDTKALYEAMCLLSTMFDAKLTVDYGKIEGNLTFWECHPGEEVGSEYYCQTKRS